MKSIDEIQDEIIEEFSVFDDWMDKYALLIDLGNALPPLDEKYKTSENLIEGCQSRVWYKPAASPTCKWYWDLSSDSSLSHSYSFRFSTG